MSLTAATFDDALAEIIASPFGDKLAAIQVLQRERLRWMAENNSLAWADGRRGDAVVKIPGLTDTLTQLVRLFAARGLVRYADMDDLHRHVSALRKRLKEMAPSVRIETLIAEGYEVTAGFDELYRLLHSGKAPSLRAQGFTVKQTAILKALSLRSSIHVDQIACLQRHVSNVRAKLKKLGAKHIRIVTCAGEGLYTVDEKSQQGIVKLLAGELECAPPAPKKAEPKQVRPPRGAKPKLIQTESIAA